jgi:predicted TIM-barrel fold metal-dependent hydrolase
MTIDMHAHWVPEALCAALRRRTVPPMIAKGDDGREYLTAGFGPGPLAPPESIESRLADMDRCGVEHAVLSVTPVYGIEALPAAEALPLCRALNDALAAAAAAHPTRFSALATLPTGDMPAALAEFDRVMALPGVVGALVPGDGFLSKQRAEKFRPLFAAADRLAAVLLGHYARIGDDPDAPKVDKSDNAHARMGSLDMQARLSQAMVTFCMTDFLDAYPNLTVLCHNLGGNLPFEIERMDHRSIIDRPGDELPSARVRRARVMVDCNSLGARSIELAADLYGANRIVLGTDGTAFGMDWSNKAIAEARIADADRRAILSDNAAAALARVRRPAAAAAE